MTESLQYVDFNKAVNFIDSTDLTQIEALEDEIIEQGVNQVDDLNSNFLIDKLCSGLYARSLIIPKGVFLTGKIHKRPYIDIFICGDVTVKSYFIDGTHEDTERVNSFRFFEGKPGRKRVLIAHETTHWITVDPTESDNIDNVSDDVVFSKMEDYGKHLEAGE